MTKENRPKRPSRLGKRSGRAATGHERGSLIDKFLAHMDDKDDWRTFTDPKTGERIKLTAEEVKVVARLASGRYADEEYDPYAPSVDFFTYKKQASPLASRVPRKPRMHDGMSGWEAKKVARIVAAIRRGVISIDDILGKKEPQRTRTTRKEVYDMWGAEGEGLFGSNKTAPLPPIHAPRMRLPGHADSYNPSGEYLPTEEEVAAWSASPEQERTPFLPTRYGSLRALPAYRQFTTERFSRCLDLYMCPRGIRQKLAVADADDLLPTLPDPRDLKPYPASRSLDFVGHAGSITGISVDATGQWLLSGCSAGECRLWEVASGQCLSSWQMQGAVSVAWNPVYPMFAMGGGCEVAIVVPAGIPRANLAESALRSGDAAASSWKCTSRADDGAKLRIAHSAPVASVAWHRKGDYLSVTCPSAETLAHRIAIHQVTKRASQTPFRSGSALIPQQTAFAPSASPLFYACTQRSVRVYRLAPKLAPVRRLLPTSAGVTGMAVHPSGDHLLTCSITGSVQWFDLDAASLDAASTIKPLRALQLAAAVRSVAWSASFPLFAAAMDNGTLQVTHARPPGDDSYDPVVVPVKIIDLRDDGGSSSDLRGMQCVWHPDQPWVFVGLSTGRIALFV